MAAIPTMVPKNITITDSSTNIDGVLSIDSLVCAQQTV